MMSSKNRYFRLALSAATGKAFTIMTLLAALPIGKVEAHHGFDGKYDASRPLYLEGTVKETLWQAPHSAIVLELPEKMQIPTNLAQLPEVNRLGGENLIVPQNLLGTEQRLELPPVGSMVSPLREKLGTGDKIRVVVYRNCEPPNQLRVQLVQLSDGTTVVRPGTVQTEVNGC